MHSRNGFIIFQDVNSWIVEQRYRYSSRIAPLTILDSKSAVFMDKNGKDTKHTRQIFRRVNLVSNGE